jgi:hypothetical protein
MVMLKWVVERFEVERQSLSFRLDEEVFGRSK